MKKITALFTALGIIALFSAFLLISCGKTDDGHEQTITDAETIGFLDFGTHGDTAPPYIPETEPIKYDFGGHEFKILNSSPFDDTYIAIDPDKTGNVLDDGCYMRNANVEEQMNVKITEETKLYQSLAEYARTLILSGEDVYDVMYLPIRDLTPLISEDLFCNILDIEEFFTYHVGWDIQTLSQNTFRDQLFYITSDLHLMATENTPCLFFNEDMMFDVAGDLPYDTALDRKWTFDEFMRICKAAADLNAESVSVFGLAADASSSLDFAYGMNAKALSKDWDGKYLFSADTNEKFTDVWSKITDLFDPDGVGLSKICGKSDEKDAESIFTDGGALFYASKLKNATHLREKEFKFGILPMPIYDDQADISSRLEADCLAFCIPKTNRNLSRTGTVADNLAYQSYVYVKPRYYDQHISHIALGKAESLNVQGFLDVSRGTEFSTAYSLTDDFYDEMSAQCVAGKKNFSEIIQKYKDGIIAELNRIYDEYPFLPNVKNEEVS